MGVIASNLSNAWLINVQDLDTTRDMWEKLKTIYDGDSHVQKAKVDSLKGNFDDMRMKENENIDQYSQIMKDVVATIKGFGGTLEEEYVVRKILRTLLP